jgi:hypothetical protein
MIKRATVPQLVADVTVLTWPQQVTFSCWPTVGVAQNDLPGVLAAAEMLPSPTIDPCRFEAVRV